MQVPLATSIIYLSGPHFGIGAGIGAVDAALVPLLATLADEKTEDSDSAVKGSSYGNTFALGQTAVSLAYCLGKRSLNKSMQFKKIQFLGPILGGFLVESVGFPTLMLSMGILNLLYSPIVFLLRPNKQSEITETTSLATFVTKRVNYRRFKNEESDD